jgi:quinone-modifying oxidoreductase subunit QmoB
MAATGGITRPSDRRPARRVAFLLCDGQRDEAHWAYGGSVASLVALKQATYVRGQGGDATAYVFYEDMQAPGQYEYFYRSVQGDPGILLSRGQVRAVTAGRDGDVVVEVADTVIGGDIRLAVDLVVLATDMVPAAAGAEGALGLKYLQGKNLPTTTHGYADSHFICFPYETRRTGIYTAGPVRRPMDIAQAREDATGAALKAIQALENAELGRAAHPRSGDLSFPKIRLEGCTQCKRCTVECPFGAIDEDEKRFPVVNESRCRRCGTCMGACPVRVISFDNYSINTVGAQIKAVDIPDEFSEKPRILILACENDAYPALDMAGMSRNEYSAFVRIIPIRCLGSVNTIWITDALNAGYDGVMLMGCKSGDEYQCHFVKGSELGRVRMSKIDDTLKTLNLESERVRDLEVAITDIERVPEMINKYAAELVAVGPSPFKGF